MLNEDVIEILKIWNKVQGNDHIYKMLNGEETIEQYLDAVDKLARDSLEEVSLKLKIENAKSEPNKYVIRDYFAEIEMATSKLERTARCRTYLASKKKA